MMTPNTTITLAYEFTHENGSKTIVGRRRVYGLWNAKQAIEEYGIKLSESTISRCIYPRLYLIADVPATIRAYIKTLCLSDQYAVTDDKATPATSLHIQIQRTQ